MARQSKQQSRRRRRRSRRTAAAPGLLQPAPKATFGQRVRTWFLAGILTTAPLGITLFIAWQFVDFVDSTVKAYWPGSRDADDLLLFAIPGVGVLLIFAVLVLIGMFTAGFVGRSLTRMAESVVNRIPAVRSIYGALKQIMETVLSSQSDAFREVVLIEYPRRGIWVLAFLTGPTRGEVKDALGSDQMVNVFVPTTPNPTSGFFLFLPEEEVHHLDMSVEDGIKMVVSAGIVTPPRPAELAAEGKQADSSGVESSGAETRRKAEPMPQGKTAGRSRSDAEQKARQKCRRKPK
ncbi:MAG: hypothetical protein Alpg2KO_24880 [Alphaproteobacteria bacterium]